MSQLPTQVSFHLESSRIGMTTDQLLRAQSGRLLLNREDYDSSVLSRNGVNSTLAREALLIVFYEADCVPNAVLEGYSLVFTFFTGAPDAGKQELFKGLYDLLTEEHAIAENKVTITDERKSSWDISADPVSVLWEDFWTTARDVPLVG